MDIMIIDQKRLKKEDYNKIWYCSEYKLEEIER